MKDKIKCPHCNNESYYELDDYTPLESLFKATNPLIENFLLYMLNCNSCGQLMEYKKYHDS